MKETPPAGPAFNIIRMLTESDKGPLRIDRIAAKPAFRLYSIEQVHSE
jgi:hypothetical protein